MPHLPQAAATRQPCPPRANWGSGAGRAWQPWGRSPGSCGQKGVGRESSYPSHLGAAVSRTLALQLGVNRQKGPGRTVSEGGQDRCCRSPADAPRQRYSPSAAARTCRSINRFYNLMQQLPARLGQMPPQNHLRPRPSPRGAPAVRDWVPAQQAAPLGALCTSVWSP